MTHQHGGRPGSGTHGGGGYGNKSGGGSCFAPGSGNRTGGGGDDDGGGYYAEETPELKREKQPEEKSTKKLFSNLWRFFVNDYEWDLSDIINIDKPCRDHCYWILTHRNGKKTKITGNVILQEV